MLNPFKRGVMTTRSLATAVAVVAMVTLAACGSDDKASTGSDKASTGTTTTAAAAPKSPIVPREEIETACQAPYIEEAKATVDTTKFKKAPKWKLGVSAAYLTNAYIVHFNQEIKYHASKDPRFGDVVVTDAGFNANKQVSDIQSLIEQKVAAIIYWPVDSKALEPALRKARAAGIVVVNSTPAYTGSDNVDADVQVDIYAYARNSAIHFLEALEGKGNITQVLTIPGTVDNELQKSALDCVLKFYPEVKLLDSQHGMFATPQTKKIADAWVQRFPDIDGVFSVYAESSLGVVSAFEQAGRLDQIKISPGNQGNGWLKFLAKHPKQNLGGVTYPVTLGGDAVKVTAKMLNGEPVTRGTFLGSEYLTPEEQAALARPDEPDSYWPNDLSPEFQPK